MKRLLESITSIVSQSQRKRHQRSGKRGLKRQGGGLITSLHHRGLRVEPMEERALLSAGLQFDHMIYNPGAGATTTTTTGAASVVSPVDATPLSYSSPVGMTPQMIRTAYGINSIMLGSVTGTGAGQTIAIIDAYDAPNFVDSTNPNFDTSDLHLFDEQFGIPDPPSFLKLNETGGTTLPVASGSTGWSVEESLDVEWAHAIAPQANIILFEANSTSDSDLITTAVNTARNWPGVTAVTMSFGRSESSSDASEETVFTTPSGHSGVTFLASTGDSGAPGGFPAFSPNVVAVGGTTLTINSSTYAYVSESGWTDGGGGQSVYEAKPSYQSGVNSTSWRQIPDISFDADPNTGVAIMDSYDYGASYPWIQVGGTSVSSPCWAGLVAIGDQLRTSVGLATMDGPTQTLPLLYSMKAADFHDITTGNNGYPAGVGYDMVTGIGSPLANQLVPAFVPVSSKGYVAFSTHAYEIGTSATVTVGDLDLAGDPTCPVTLTSSAGDSETLSLSATGGGVFLGSIVTSSAPVTPGDGILETVPGGTITVTYQDANDGTGHPATVTDQATTFSVDHFTFSTVSGPETAGVPFSVTVSAYDSSSHLLSGYDGTATLTALGAAGALSVNPTSVTFASGTWTGNVTVNAVDPTVTLTATDPLGGAGASSTFATQPGPLASFQSSTIASPQYKNVAFPVTLTAKDANGYTATGYNGTATLSGLIGSTTTGKILGPVTPTWGPYSGYYTMGYSFEPSANLLVTDVLHYYGTKVSVWTSGGTLVGSQSFPTAPAGWTDTPVATPFQLVAGATYVIGDYSGGGTYYGFNCSYPYPSSLGTIAEECETTSGDAFPTSHYNTYMEPVDLLVQVGSYTSVPISPTTVTFAAGVWTGHVMVQQAGTGVHLHVDDGVGQTGDSNTFDVANLPPVTPVLPTDVTVGAGTVNATLTIPAALSSDLVVDVTSSDPGRVTVPATVTISAGATSAPLPLTIIDNGLLYGPESIAIGTTATGYSPFSANFTLHDNLSAVLSVSLPTSANENAGVLAAAGTVTCSAPAQNVVVVQLSSSDTTGVTVPATVTIPAGQTSATFDVTMHDDHVIEGNRPIGVTAQMDTWTSGSATMTDIDDDGTVAVSLPASGWEGQTLTGAGTLTLGGTLAAPLTVSLSSSDSTELWVPATVTVPAGQRTATFTVTLLDNGKRTGPLSEMVTATATTPYSVINGSGTMVVDDADVDHYTFTTIAGPQTAGVAFSVTARAYDILGNPILVYNGTAALTAAGHSGALPVTPTSVTFVSGVWTGNVTVNGVDPSVSLQLSNGAGIASTSGTFAVQPGPLAAFQWSTVASPQYQYGPFPETLTATDAHGYTATGFNGTLNVGGEVPGATVTDGTGTYTSSIPLDTSYDQARTQVIYEASELGGAGLITGLALDVGGVPGQPMNKFTIRMQSTTLSSYSTYAWQGTGWTTVYQTNQTISSTGWTTFNFTTPFAYDGVSNLMVDFSFNDSSYSSYGYTYDTYATQTRELYYYTDNSYGDPLTWSGPSSPSPYTNSYIPNIRLSMGAPVTVAPTTVALVGGVWTGNLTVSQVAAGMSLWASDGNGHGGASNTFNVVARPFTVSLPANVTEGQGPATGTISVPVAPSADLTVDVACSDPNRLTVPSTVTIPAGQTSVAFSFGIVDSSLLQGPEAVTISAAALGYVTGSGTVTVHDINTAVLTVILPAGANEDAGVLSGAGTITSSAAPVRNILVQLSSNDTTGLTVPQTVILPAGQTTASFDVTMIDDHVIEGNRPITVTAQMDNWTPGSATMTDIDDDDTLAVSLPASGWEGQTLAGAGTVRLGGTLTSPLVVSLTSADTTELTVPATVTIPAGQLTASFDVTLVENYRREGPESVAVTAVAAGLPTAGSSMVVNDSDVDHFTFDVISGPKTAGVPFTVTARAYDVMNNLILDYNTAVTLTALGQSGPLSLSTSSATFAAGVWTGSISVNAVDPNVTLQLNNGAGVTATSGAFATQAGPMASLQWSTVASPEYQNLAFPATVTATDAHGYPVTSFSGTANLTGLVGTTTPVTLLNQPTPTYSFSDTETNGQSFTPSANLLVTDFIHYYGTKVSLWTSTGTLLGSQTYSSTPGSWTDTPLTTPIQLIGGTTYVIATYSAGQTIYYRTDMSSTSPVGTILQSYWGSGDTFPTNLDSPHWYMTDLRGNLGTYTPVSVSPTTVTLTGGVWTGNVMVQQAAAGMHLHADDGAGQTGDSNTFDASNAPRVTPVVPTDVTVGAGVVNATLSIPAALGGDLAVNVTSSDPNRVSVPATVTIPAGATSVALPLTIIDNGLLYGPESIVIGTTATGYGPFSATFTLHDNLSAVLSVSLPISANENAGVLAAAGTVSFSAPAQNAVVVQLSSSDTTGVTVPATVTIPAGQTSATFNVTMHDDHVVEGNRPISVTAQMDTWTSGSATMTDIDDDGTLAVTLPASGWEGQTLWGAGSVQIGGTLTSNLTVNLTSADTTELSVPATVTIPAGQTTASFDVTLVSNGFHQGPETVAVTAAAAGLTGGSAAMVVRDSNVDHFTMSAVASPQDGGVAFPMTITACDIDGNPILIYNGTATLTAAGQSGSLPMTPESVTFTSGVWTGNVTVNALDPNVVLRLDNGAGAFGTSNSFVVQAGPVAGFQWSTIPSSAYQGVSFPVTVTATDAHGYTASSYNGTVGLGGYTAPTTVTDGTGTYTSSLPLDTSYEQVRTQVIYEASELGGPGLITGLALNVGGIPGQTMNNFTIRLQPTTLSSYSTYAWQGSGWTTAYQSNQTISSTGWTNFAFTTPFHYDGVSNLMVDFSFNDSSYSSYGYVYETSVTQTRELYYYTDGGYGDPLTWSGTSSPSPYTNSYIPNIRLSIAPPVSIGPTTATLTDGVWTGTVAALQTASGVYLRADDGVGQAGNSGSFNVLPITLTLTAPSNITEGAVVNGTLSLPAALSSDTPIWLVSTDPARLTVPATAIIPAGRLSVSVPLTAVDTGVLEGPEQVTINASAAGGLTANAAVTVHDYRTAVLSVSLPASANENAGVLAGAGTVTSSAAAADAVVVQLSSSDTTGLTVPATVTIPAGQTSANFNVTMVDDHVIEGNRPISVTAQMDAWNPGSATMTDDDTDGTLSVSLPASGWEGQTLTTAGKLTLGGTLAAPLTVSLVSNDPNRLSVPATVTVPAGQMTATFTVTLLPYSQRTGPVTDQVTATSATTPDGVLAGSATMVLDDSNLDHYAFATIGSPKLTGMGFPVTITADDILGNQILVYNGTATLSATGQSGTLPVSPTSVTFASGAWTGNVTISAIDPAAMLQVNNGAGAAGTSNTFAVKGRVQVTTTSPAPNGAFSLPGPLTYDVNFSEPVAPSSVTTGSLVLSGISGATVAGVTLANGNTTAVYTLNVPTVGTLTASIAAGAVTDQYGYPNAAFSASYLVNIGTEAFPVPLASVAPSGSLVYGGSTSGLVAPAGDTNNFTISVAAGETITALVQPAAGLQPTVQVSAPGGSPLGSAAAGAAGGDALLETVTAPTSGSYTITVGAVGSTTGTYTVTLYLNAALEADVYGGATNNTLATAQDLTGSFVLLGTSVFGAQRGAVLGTTAAGSTPEYYSFTANTTETDTFGLTGLAAGTLTVSLYNSGGTLLATGVGGSSNLSSVIGNFNIPGPGTYYASVTGTSGVAYSLVVCRDAAFGTEPNQTQATAQSLSGVQGVLGSVNVGVAGGDVVVPNADTTVMGDSDNGYPFNLPDVSSYTSMRYQQIYSASQLAAGTITALRFRLASGNSPFSTSGIDARIDIGYAATTVATASATFANNRSADVVTEVNGLISLSSTSTTTPRAFDIVINFPTPFTYNPADGDLLLDVFMENALYTAQFDAVSVGSGGTATARIWAGGVSSTTGTVDDDECGLVTRFDYSPPTNGWYSINVSAAGQTLNLSTSTPPGGPGQFVNNLVPNLQLYDSSGDLLATGAVGPDGRNQSINYTATAPGTYYVEVSALNATQGEYYLNVNNVLSVTAPANLTEGQGTVNGTVNIAAAPTSDLVVNLASSDTNRLTVPATVTIPAGQVSVALPITIVNTAALYGPEAVTLSATATGCTPGVGTIEVHDDKTAVLSVGLPASANENAGVLVNAGTVTASAAAQNAVVVQLSSNDTTGVTVPATVTIPAGQTSATFNVTTHDDHVIDGNRPISVTAQMDNWTSGAATMTDIDDDGTLAVSLPASGWEGQTLTGAGTLTLGGTLTAPLTVALVSSDPTRLSVPSTVTVPAGQTTAAFTVTLLNNGLHTGPVTDQVTATAATTPDGVLTGSATMTVDDSNLDHYTFTTIAGPETAGLAFPVTVTGDDIKGNPILVYNGTAALTAAGQSGTLPITPTSVTFASGTWTGNVTVGAADPAAVLTVADGLGHTASSNSFVVGVPDLTITKTHVGDFSPGDVGDTYTITVSNIGSGPTYGTVSVVDTLPTGLTAAGLSGSGWTVNPSTLTATRSSVLAAGASYPALTVTVDVSSSPPALVTNVATVSGGGELNTGNDTAHDPTTIKVVPPTITSTTPSLTSGMVNNGAATLAINFSKVVVGAGTASNYELQSVGPDGLLGTADDVIVPLSASYSGTTATLTFAGLTQSVYRLTVLDNITDTGGTELDGNGNGNPGSNYVCDFVVLPPAAGLSFAPAVVTSCGSSQTPVAEAVGDFNGGGKQDLVVATGQSVLLMLSNGAGGFSSITTLPGSSAGATALAVGDFNHDGNLDVAATVPGGGVMVWLGNGSGGFSAPATFPTADSDPDAIVAGDFNSDGNLDLAVADSDNNTVSLLLGDGHGNFGAPTSFSSGGVDPVALATADFNGDGKLDLAVVNETSATVGVLLGNGAGGFSPVTTYATGGSDPTSVAAADLNHDGNPDLVVVNSGSYGPIGVLLGNGAGGFSPVTQTYITAATAPTNVAIGDFNGDGNLDVAVSNDIRTGTAIILLGDGTGGFSSQTSFSTGGRSAMPIVAGDFVGNGMSDLAVGNLFGDSIGVLLNGSGPPLETLTTADGDVFDVQTGTFGAGQLVAGTNNPFHGLNRLKVGGADYQPAATAAMANSGQTVVVGPQTLAGLSVSRQVTVPNTGSQDFARTVDSFTNPTGSPITTAVTIVGDLGSGAATTVFATSDGTGVVSPNDQWIGTDGGSSPAVISYIHGPAGLQPTSVALTGSNISWTYNITVPAGQTVTLAYFTIVSPTSAGAIAAANALVGPGGFGGQAGAFLSASQVSSLANFLFPPVATVALNEHAPLPADVLTATATDSDADGNPVTLTYVWTANGTVERTFTSTALTDTFNLSTLGAGDAGDTVVVSVTPNDGILTGTAVTDTATVSDTPRVANVVVGSDAWSGSFVSYLAAQNPANAGGYSIPVGSGAQLLPLPWTNIDQIKVTFSENVTVAQTDLMLEGVNTPSYNVAGGTFAYNAATFTATWTLPAAIPDDKLLLELNADGADPIHDALGNRLDGEWTNPVTTSDTGTSQYPSGDGTPGSSNFLFRFNVLPGDVNQDGYVQALDGLLVRGALGSTAGQGNYSIFRDVNGDGAVLSSDGLLVLGRLGTSLPAGQPVASAFPSATGNTGGSFKSSPSPTLPKLGPRELALISVVQQLENGGLSAPLLDPAGGLSQLLSPPEAMASAVGQTNSGEST